MSGISGISPVAVDGVTFPEITPKEPSKLLTILDTIKKVADTFREKIWAFVKELGKITSSSLKIAAGVIPLDPKDNSHLGKIAKGVHTAIAALGLASFVTMLVNFVSIPFSAKSAVEKGMIGDVEGGVLSTTDAVMGAVETVGDMGSGVSALAALGAIPFIAAFSIIALPFAIAGLSYAVGKGIYNLGHNAKYLHDMRMIANQEVTASKADSLRKYIDSKLNVSKEEIKDEVEKEVQKALTANKYVVTVDTDAIEKSVLAKRIKMKESIFKRRADPKMVELMKKLRVQLDENAKDKEETAELALQHIKGYMWRKIGISSIGIVANLTLLSALIASLIMPVMSPIAMPIVGGVKAVLGIGKAGLNMGLDRWHNNWYDENKAKFAAAAA